MNNDVHGSPINQINFHRFTTMKSFCSFDSVWVAINEHNLHVHNSQSDCSLVLLYINFWHYVDVVPKIKSQKNRRFLSETDEYHWTIFAY